MDTDELLRQARDALGAALSDMLRNDGARRSIPAANSALAAIDAHLTQHSAPSGEQADLMGEARHAITALLSLIRRNAPELSGKTLGYAEAVAAKIATAQAAPAPQAEPTDEEIGHVTISQARAALDSMDDFARMKTGVDAMGPRRTLEVFITQAEAAPAAPAPQAATVQSLTESQTHAMWVAATIEPCTHWHCYRRGVIDGERAHGITATPAKG